MLLQTNSYIVPAERRADHARLIRRFRQAMSRIGCDQFEVYEQVGPGWSPGSNGRYVQIMRFRDRQHQQAVQAAERSDPGSQQIIAEFCDLINFPYQQQHGYFATSFYTSVLPVGPRQLVEYADEPAEDSAEEEATAIDDPGSEVDSDGYVPANEEVEAGDEAAVAEEEVADQEEQESTAAAHHFSDNEVISTVTAVASEHVSLASDGHVANELTDLQASEPDELPALESEALESAELPEVVAPEPEALSHSEFDELPALESNPLEATELPELAAAEPEDLLDFELDELPALRTSELEPADLPELGAREPEGIFHTEINEGRASESDRLESAALPESAALEPEGLLHSELDEFLAMESVASEPADSVKPPVVEATDVHAGSHESVAADAQDLLPAGSDEFGDADSEESLAELVETVEPESDEYLPPEIEELTEAEAEQAALATFEELPSEAEDVAPAELEESAATEEVAEEAAEETAPAELSPLEAAEQAAILAGELLPDDVETTPLTESTGGLEVQESFFNPPPATAAPHGEAPTESSEEAVEDEDDAIGLEMDGSSPTSFIDSLTEEDLQASENVIEELAASQHSPLVGNPLSDPGFAEATFPTEVGNDLVTADAFSPAEPAVNDNTEEDDAGDSLVDRLGDIEAEHLLDDPAHDRAAMLHDEFDPEQAIAEDLGLEFDAEPPASPTARNGEDDEPEEAAKDQPMIEFEAFLRELENPAADPGRRSH